MTTYTKDDGEAADVCAKMLKKYHSDLAACKVTVEVLFASNEEGPAVTKNGWPCAALAKINSLKDRAAGLADARIIVDYDVWERFDAKQRDALMDHELTHFELARTKDGSPKYDDLDRPKLKSKPHDWEVGGFDCIAQRHGSKAPEVVIEARIWHRLEQMEIDWNAALATEPATEAA